MSSLSPEQIEELLKSTKREPPKRKTKNEQLFSKDENGHRTFAQWWKIPHHSLSEPCGYCGRTDQATTLTPVDQKYVCRSDFLAGVGE